MDFHLKRLRNNPKGPHGPIPPKLRARSARPPVRARSARAARRTARKRRPSRPFSAPCRSEERASRKLGGGANSAGTYKQVGGYARSVNKGTCLSKGTGSAVYVEAVRLFHFHRFL